MMKTEAELIERIRLRIPSRAGSLRIGIGDDAAVLHLCREQTRRASHRVDWVWSCDAFLENVHFLAAVHPPDSVGFKALARATSDLAAMGALPKFFLLSLALPANRTTRWLDGFLAGMARAARQFGLTLAGGDTAQHPTVAISITALGEVSPGRAVSRSGARPRDQLYVTGRPGAAQLGLELVLRGLYRERRWRHLLRPHLYPELRLALSRWLSGRKLASAMIDTSDGLSADLEHLCQSSGVGARLWADRIPMVRVPRALQARGFDPRELALHGGEDYELLFTVPSRFSQRVPTVYRGVPITPIGEIIPGRTMLLVEADGRTATLEARGWDHFRSPRR